MSVAMSRVPVLPAQERPGLLLVEEVDRVEMLTIG